MKTNFVYATIIICALIANSLQAQEKKNKLITAEFGVEGVCNECKERIENGALIKGVKLAEWDKKTRQIKVVFRTDKTNLDTIHKAIAAVGHDTDKVKATDGAYSKLPDCCAYRDGVETH